MYIGAKSFYSSWELETQIIIKGQVEEVVKVEPDDQFMHAIEFFGACMEDNEKSKEDVIYI